MVVGTDENGQPIKANGTSFSAPQVTSAIALLQSINPKLTADEIKELLVKDFKRFYNDLIKRLGFLFLYLELIFNLDFTKGGGLFNIDLRQYY